MVFLKVDSNYHKGDRCTEAALEGTVVDFNKKIMLVTQCLSVLL